MAPRNLCHRLWHNWTMWRVEKIPLANSIQIAAGETFDVGKFKGKIAGKAVD